MKKFTFSSKCFASLCLAVGISLGMAMPGMASLAMADSWDDYWDKVRDAENQFKDIKSEAEKAADILKGTYVGGVCGYSLVTSTGIIASAQNMTDGFNKVQEAIQKIMQNQASMNSALVGAQSNGSAGILKKLKKQSNDFANIINNNALAQKKYEAMKASTLGSAVHNCDAMKKAVRTLLQGGNESKNLQHSLAELHDKTLEGTQVNEIEARNMSLQLAYGYLANDDKLKATDMFPSRNVHSPETLMKAEAMTRAALNPTSNPKVADVKSAAGRRAVEEQAVKKARLAPSENILNMTQSWQAPVYDLDGFKAMLESMRIPSAPVYLLHSEKDVDGTPRTSFIEAMNFLVNGARQDNEAWWQDIDDADDIRLLREVLINSVLGANLEFEDFKMKLSHASAIATLNATISGYLSDQNIKANMYGAGKSSLGSASGE